MASIDEILTLAEQEIKEMSESAAFADLISDPFRSGASRAWTTNGQPD